MAANDIEFVMELVAKTRTERKDGPDGETDGVGLGEIVLVGLNVQVCKKNELKDTGDVAD